MSNPLKELKNERDALFEKLTKAKSDAAAAAARARKANKAEAEDTARRAVELKSQVARISDQLKTAEKDLKVAQKEHEKSATRATEKLNATQAAQAAEQNPLMASKVDYFALGKWLADQAKDRVCFVEGAGWGEWTGTHWQFDERPSAELLDRVRTAYNTVASDVVAKLNENAMAAENILKHAQGALTLSRNLFNQPTVAHLVAFKNYTVNLRNGETMDHNPKHYMTGALQCDYNPDADLDRILSTFARFWPEDAETAEMFQTVVGYSLTAETEAKITPMLVGNQENTNDNGDNGKSLVQNALAVMHGTGKGGWGSAVKASLIIDTGDRDANSHDAAKKPLIWRRYAMATEMRKGASVDAGEFNRLSGGDILTARMPHAPDGVEFVNFSTIFLSFNQAPRFKTWDKATKKRLCPFPFYETFYDPGSAPEGAQEQEPGLKTWLLSKYGQEALALYAVRGAVRYYALNGGEAGRIPVSDAVAQLRDEILQSSNPYEDFFEEYLHFTSGAATLKSAINELFKEYLGHRPRPHETVALSDVLKTKCELKKMNGGLRYFNGVSLNEKGKKIVAFSGHNNAVVIKKEEPLTHPANFGRAS